MWRSDAGVNEGNPHGGILRCNVEIAFMNQRKGPESRLIQPLLPRLDSDFNISRLRYGPHEGSVMSPGPVGYLSAGEGNPAPTPYVSRRAHEKG
jgi:hypothetical protein